jgi:hypothetical protein
LELAGQLGPLERNAWRHAGHACANRTRGFGLPGASSASAHFFDAGVGEDSLAIAALPKMNRISRWTAMAHVGECYCCAIGLNLRNCGA